MNRMRAFWTASALALSAAASAQLTNYTDLAIRDGLEKLHLSSLVRLDLVGTETVGGRLRSFSYTLYFQQYLPNGSTKPVYLIDLLEYDNSGRSPVLTHRYVGDGISLTSYDMVNRQYASTFYNNPTDTATFGSSQGFKTLLSKLFAVVPSNPSYMVRLLQESYLSERSSYTTWAPGATLKMVREGSALRDPIVATRMYISSEKLNYWVYGAADQNPRRTVAFVLADLNNDPDKSPDWHLIRVHYADRSMNRVTDWTMIISPDQASPSWAFRNYTAAELSGWIPVASARLSNGG